MVLIPKDRKVKNKTQNTKQNKIKQTNKQTKNNKKHKHKQNKPSNSDYATLMNDARTGQLALIRPVLIIFFFNLRANWQLNATRITFILQS